MQSIPLAARPNPAVSHPGARVNYTAVELIRRFPNHFLQIDSRNRIVCSLCKSSISRAETFEVQRHLNSAKHLRNIQRFITVHQNRVYDSPANPRVDFDHLISEKNEFLDDLCQLFVTLNCSFRWFDDSFINRFFIKWTRNNLGHSILRSTRMRARLNDLFARRKQTLIDKLRPQSSVHLIVDETTDSRGRHILNIIASYFDLEATETVSLLLCSVELVSLQNPNEIANADGEIVAHFVRQTILEFSLRCDQLFSFVTDNASYMASAFRILFYRYNYKCMTHLTCYSHILHLVCKDIVNKFPAVKTLIAAIKR